MKITPVQAELLTRFSDEGESAKWWSRGADAERLYLTYRADVSLWVEFDDARTCQGANVQCEIRPCGQTAKWYESQRNLALAFARDAFEIVVVYSREIAALPASELEAKLAEVQS